MPIAEPNPRGKGPGVTTVGGAAGTIIFIGGVFGVLHYILIELTKLIRAGIRSIREIRNDVAEYRAERRQASVGSPTPVPPLDTDAGHVLVTPDRDDESATGVADPDAHGRGLPT